MESIRYSVGGVESLDRVAPLWEQLKAHHVEPSPHFSAALADVAFSERRDQLVEKASDGELRIDFATSGGEDRDVGYCISTIGPNHNGELDSIFVAPAARGRGIGTDLICRALAWFDARQVQSKVIAVAVGNERLLLFYARFGFLPRTIVLQQRKEYHETWIP